jgi:ubiquinone/menaquinone biosynthesis C-methylase UbiE
MSRDADRWSRWHAVRDSGGVDEGQVVSARLLRAREELLSAVEPLDGATLLDVGTGDGLVGLGALDLVGTRGSVIFSDISAPLLERCREAVNAHPARERARFVVARAEDLVGVADSSVEVVTARAVLVFVADKAGAFAAMHRVLRPGGRISLREVVGRLMFPEPPERFWGYDLSSVVELCLRVKAAHGELENPAFRAAMLDFDDRDLVDLARAAGFDRVHVECHIDLEPGALMPGATLERLLESAPTPVAPTIGEAVDRALNNLERREFLTALRDAIHAGNAIRRTAIARVVAHKPLEA